MSDLSDEELERHMMAVHEGMERIAATYGDHVVLMLEDPETFGAGHYVFYPVEGNSPRFAVTEEYTGTDWSDDERVPTSWSWEIDVAVPAPDGAYPRLMLASGEVASADYLQLLEITDGWVSAVHQLAEREAALTVAPIHAAGAGREDPGRTFLT